MSEKFIVLDRDGVINVDLFDYVLKKETVKSWYSEVLVRSCWDPGKVKVNPSFVHGVVGYGRFS